jgi:hypothetical protein
MFRVRMEAVLSSKTLVANVQCSQRYNVAYGRDIYIMKIQVNRKSEGKRPLKSKGKGKGVPLHAMEAHGGEEG